jgi:hypothetical protein
MDILNVINEMSEYEFKYDNEYIKIITFNDTSVHVKAIISNIIVYIMMTYKHDKIDEYKLQWNNIFEQCNDLINYLLYKQSKSDYKINIEFQNDELLYIKLNINNKIILQDKHVKYLYI